MTTPNVDCPAPRNAQNKSEFSTSFAVTMLALANTTCNSKTCDQTIEWKRQQKQNTVLSGCCIRTRIQENHVGGWLGARGAKPATYIVNGETVLTGPIPPESDCGSRSYHSTVSLFQSPAKYITNGTSRTNGGHGSRGRWRRCVAAVLGRAFVVEFPVVETGQT